jgi:hypothetical protein
MEKQFQRLDKLWSTIASHSKETIIEAVLLDERDRAVAGADHSMVRSIDYRLKDLVHKPRPKGINMNDAKAIAPDK